MMIRMLRFLSLVPVMLAMLSFPCWSVEVGDSMPEFTIEAFDGAKVSKGTLKDKPLLLIFWNTWCPNCMRELPEIKRLHETYGPKGLAILAVNTAMNDSEAKARAYWDQYGYRFAGAFDRYFETGQAFGVISVPTVFLFDSRGIARYKQARLPEDVEDRLTQLIGEH